MGRKIFLYVLSLMLTTAVMSACELDKKSADTNNEKSDTSSAVQDSSIDNDVSSTEDVSEESVEESREIQVSEDKAPEVKVTVKGGEISLSSEQKDEVCSIALECFDNDRLLKLALTDDNIAEFQKNGIYAEINFDDYIAIQTDTGEFIMNKVLVLHDAIESYAVFFGANDVVNIYVLNDAQKFLDCIGVEPEDYIGISAEDIEISIVKQGENIKINDRQKLYIASAVLDSLKNNSQVDQALTMDAVEQTGKKGTALTITFSSPQKITVDSGEFEASEITVLICNDYQYVICQGVYLLSDEYRDKIEMYI